MSDILPPPVFTPPVNTPPSFSFPPPLQPPEPSLPGSILQTGPASSVSDPAATPTDSSSSPSSVPSTTSSDTASVSSSMAVVVSSTLSPTSSAVPVSASSSSHNHAGAIAGGVIGGLAVVVALVAVLLFYRYKRKSAYPVRRHGRNGSNGGGSLAKYDLYGAEGGVLKNSPARHASTGSTATMVNGHSRSLSIPGLSMEDISSAEDDKMSTPSLHGHKPLDLFDMLPPLPTIESMPNTPITAASAVGRTRTRSSTSQNRAAALAKLDSPGYPPTSPPGAYNTPIRRQSMDIRLLSSPPGSAGVLPPSNTEMTRLNRSSSGARRTARKAVPKYNEAEFTSPTTPSRPQTSDGRSDDAHTLHSARASLHVTKSKEDLAAAGLEVPPPDLTHKLSFGEMKPVHYLIPDLPPSQKA